MRERFGAPYASSWGSCTAETEGRLAAWGAPQWLRTLDFAPTQGLATGLVISLAGLPAPGPGGELDTSHPMLSFV